MDKIRMQIFTTIQQKTQLSLIDSRVLSTSFKSYYMLHLKKCYSLYSSNTYLCHTHLDSTPFAQRQIYDTYGTQTSTLVGSDHALPTYTLQYWCPFTCIIWVELMWQLHLTFAGKWMAPLNMQRLGDAYHHDDGGTGGIQSMYWD